jgi:hypothetical protein
MADQNQHHRRPHFHRGRRGHDRRGNDRRPPSQSPEQGAREGNRDHVDVEQIMREIRSRISQRHGIELSTQQIQELAARRLEAILDPRTVKPSLLEQIRRSASGAEAPAASQPDATYSFEETTLYESHRGALRFIRRLLNPLLKLFFNPTPLIHALNTQVRMNKAAAEREAERERRQAEWNALHYEILQRLVLEISRSSLETQQLALRVEALSAKVDFAERRARSIESTLQQARPAQRFAEGPVPTPPVVQPRETAVVEGAAPHAPTEGTSEGSRRRRRRRRGRRHGLVPEGGAGLAAAPALGGATLEGTEPGDVDEAESDEEEGALENAASDESGFSAAVLEIEETPPLSSGPPEILSEDAYRVPTVESVETPAASESPVTDVVESAAPSSSFDQAQDASFDVAQDRSFDVAQDNPFDDGPDKPTDRE